MLQLTRGYWTKGFLVKLRSASEFWRISFTNYSYVTESVSRMNTDVFGLYWLQARYFFFTHDLPLSVTCDRWFTCAPWWMPLVEHDVNTLLELLGSTSVFGGVRVAQTLLYYILFCGPLFVFYCFSFWPLCCLLFCIWLYKCCFRTFLIVIGFYIVSRYI